MPVYRESLVSDLDLSLTQDSDVTMSNFFGI